jgi:hypothetical protein
VVETSRLGHFFLSGSKRWEEWFVVDGNNDLKEENDVERRSLLP